MLLASGILDAFDGAAVGPVPLGAVGETSFVKPGGGAVISIGGGDDGAGGVAD